MSKVNSKNDATQIALLGVLKQQSLLLLVSMFLTFILMFLIEAFHYANNVIGENVPNMAYAYGMGLSIAAIQQLSRISFGISGAYEFAKGNPGKGLLGLLFSLILTVYCSYEVAEIAIVWSGGNESLLWSAQLVLFFIVWAGFVLEIRLAISISGEAKEDKAIEQTGTLLKETPHMAKSESLPVSQNGIAHVELGKG